MIVGLGEMFVDEWRLTILQASINNRILNDVGQNHWVRVTLFQLNKVFKVSNDLIIKQFMDDAFIFRAMLPILPEIGQTGLQDHK